MTFSVPPTRHAVLPGGERVGYWREGQGQPVLLLHGYPETKRIWLRVFGALVEAGFDVIAPDLPGYGESEPPVAGTADIPAAADALRALLCEVIGIRRACAIAGDYGAQVLLHLGAEHPGLIDRQIVFNTTPPGLRDSYRAAGIPRDPSRRDRPQSRYFLRQGMEADALLAELDGEQARLDYITAFYRDGGWAADGAFTAAEARWHAEPFADSDRLRTAWHSYEVACGTRPPTRMPRLFEPVAVPSMVLYGAADPVVLPSFVDKCRVAFTHCPEPVVLPGCGHFVPWERPKQLTDIAHRFFSTETEESADPIDSGAADARG